MLENSEQIRVCKKCNSVLNISEFPIIYKKYKGEDYKSHRHTCAKCYHKTRSEYYKKRYKAKKEEKARTVQLD